MDLKDSFEVSADKSRVWSVVSDVNKFSKCLPDVTSISVDGDNFDLRFNPDVSKYTNKFLGASYLSNINIKFQGGLSNKEDQKHVEINGKGSAAGLKFSVLIKIDLEEKNSKIAVNWAATIEIGMLAKIFGESVINDAISTTVKQIISCLQNKIEKSA